MKPIAFVKLCDISTIVKQVCMEYVLMRSSLEMDQFYKGLETLGIGYLLRTSSAVVKQLFVSNNQGVITVRKLQEILIPEFSPRGSNIREEEEAIIMNWNDYLKDIEGAVEHTRKLMCTWQYKHSLIPRPLPCLQCYT
jgi:hypothetical protein